MSERSEPKYSYRDIEGLREVRRRATEQAIEAGAWVDFSGGDLIERAQEDMREDQIPPKERALQKVATLDAKQFQVFEDTVDLQISFGQVMLAKKEGKGLRKALARNEKLSNKGLRALDNTEYNRASTHIRHAIKDLVTHCVEVYPDEFDGTMKFIEDLEDIRDQEVKKRGLPPRPKTPLKE
jgi:hypothetical protein